MSYEYESVTRVVYGDEGATFVPICETCGRFVKADESVLVSDSHGLKPVPNATCSKCGRVEMLFEGFL